VEAEREAVRQDYLEELVGVVGQTFLGLTMNCGALPRSQVDPIPQKDFYRMKRLRSGVAADDWGGILSWRAGPADAFRARGRERRMTPLQERIREVETEIAMLYRSARA